MKEKIETLLALNKEIKEHCYHLANKWSEYRKSLDPVVKDYECGIYNYIEISPDKIEFDISSDKGEIYFFKIGYEHSDRCGDTEQFYTYFTKEQLLDESLIKAEIDEVYQDKLDKQAKENEKIAKRKQEIDQKEFERYLELKEKFENTEKFVNSNKLIAEFMGGIYSTNAEAWGFGNARINENPINIRGILYENLVWAERFEFELKYHSSWDWLMPVCLKLNMEFVNTDMLLTYKNVIDEIRNLGEK